MDEEHYADWEWQPLDRMPDGCSDVSIKGAKGDVTDMCSCDYWWKSDNDKVGFTSFRYT